MKVLVRLFVAIYIPMFIGFLWLLRHDAAPRSWFDDIFAAAVFIIIPAVILATQWVLSTMLFMMTVVLMRNTAISLRYGIRQEIFAAKHKFYYQLEEMSDQDVRKIV